MNLMAPGSGGTTRRITLAGLGAIFQHAVNVVRRCFGKKPVYTLDCQPDKIGYRNELDRKARKFIERRKQCPDCKQGQFIMGPHFGMCVNVKCDLCGHAFNVAFLDGRCVLAQRI